VNVHLIGNQLNPSYYASAYAATTINLGVSKKLLLFRPKKISNGYPLSTGLIDVMQTGHSLLLHPTLISSLDIKCTSFLPTTKINYSAESNTFGKFFSRTPMIAIVAEQTNAAELDRPDPA
jgi:hypothetical protein